MTDVSYQDRKCPQCGKEFFVWNAEDWVYRRNGRALCSWHCVRAFDSGGNVRRMNEREKVIQAIKDGLSTREISNLLGVDTQKVWYWRKKLKKEEENEDA